MSKFQGSHTSLSEVYQQLEGGTIKLGDPFWEYELTGDVYHEAGFDALMTGAVLYRLMLALNNGKWPGLPKILASDEYNTMDKNRVPLASIRKSLDLSKPEDPEELSSLVSPELFLYILEGVPLNA